MTSIFFFLTVPCLSLCFARVIYAASGFSPNSTNAANQPISTVSHDISAAIMQRLSPTSANRVHSNPADTAAKTHIHRPEALSAQATPTVSDNSDSNSDRNSDSSNANLDKNNDVNNNANSSVNSNRNNNVYTLPSARNGKQHNGLHTTQQATGQPKTQSSTPRPRVVKKPVLTLVPKTTAVNNNTSATPTTQHTQHTQRKPVQKQPTQGEHSNIVSLFPDASKTLAIKASKLYQREFMYRDFVQQYLDSRITANDDLNTYVETHTRLRTQAAGLLKLDPVKLNLHPED